MQNTRSSRGRLAQIIVDSPTGQQSSALANVRRRVRRMPFFKRRAQRLTDQLVYDPTFNQYSVAQQRLETSIQRTSVAFWLAVAGLVVTPLNWLAIALLIYGFSNRFFLSLQKVRRGIFDVDLISSVTIATGLLSGNVLVATIVAGVFFRALRVTLRVKGDTQNQMINVFKEQPMFVWLLEDGEEIKTPFSILEKDDIVVVPAGSVIPVDGVVEQGFAAIDERALTGESQPVERGVGEPVLASTVVLSGKLYVRVEKAGDDTKVAQIGNILNASVKRKSEVMLKSEQMAEDSVLPTLLASAVVIPFVGLTGSFALLTSHFRKRPSLFASVVLLNYFSILSNNRILVKDGRALDVLADVDTVVFDKTGTLTIAQPLLHEVHVCGDVGEDDILRMAAAAEDRQSHPVALAIIRAAQDRGLDIPEVDHVEYELGFGLYVTIGHDKLHVGSRRFIDREGIGVPHHIDHMQDMAHQDGHSVIMVALNGKLIGALELIPQLRPEARQVIESLRAFGVKETYIISGDHEQPTRKLARELDIDHYYAETLPEQKASIIQELVDQGRVVCYIGDGINDAIALQTAQVSISMSGASSVATDAAQIILLDESLGQLPLFFQYGRQYDRVASTVLYWTVGLGVAGMGAAVFPAGLAYSVILSLTSLGTGLAMSMAPLTYYHWQQLMLPAPKSQITAIPASIGDAEAAPSSP